jgi:hypothetical protein
MRLVAAAHPRRLPADALHPLPRIEKGRRNITSRLG